MSRIVAEVVEIGPFFTGDTSPDVAGVLFWDTGGYVDLTGATVKFSVQRWDPLKRRRWGPLVAGGLCTLGAAQNGEANYSWSTAALPTSPGWYAGRFIVEFADATVQNSQDCVFEVREGAEVPVTPP